MRAEELIILFKGIAIFCIALGLIVIFITVMYTLDEYIERMNNRKMNYLYAQSVVRDALEKDWIQISGEVDPRDSEEIMEAIKVTADYDT